MWSTDRSVVMNSTMEVEVEESRVDMEGVDNGWADGKTKVSAGNHGGVVENEVEVVDGKKSRESRESRRKRKEREAAGDVVEDVEVKEERKKRRDEKDKRRTKDLDENERRDHRESRDRKEAKRKKEKENKERKERGDDRHGIDKDSRVKEDGKELNLRDASDRRSRREKRLEKKDSVDVDVYVREARDPVRGSTGDRTHARKENLVVASCWGSAVVDDEQEEGEILDEDSGPAKEWGSDGICMREAVKLEGVQTEVTKTEKNRFDSVLLEKLSLVDETKIERREVESGKADRTGKSSPNALQSMLGIAEAYDSEGQASDEKPSGLAGARFEKLPHVKESENGRARSAGPDHDGRSVSENTRGVDKSDGKKHLMDPPEQRGSEVKDKKYSRTGETRLRHEGSRSRSTQVVDVGHDNDTDVDIPKEKPKSMGSRQSLSPAADDGAYSSGKRGNGGRRRRSPTPDNLKDSSRDRHQRKGRSRSRDSENRVHTERGRSPSLESGKERGVLRKRTLSPDVVKSRVQGRSPSREGVRDRRAGVDLQDRKKRSWSPNESYERRHSSLERGRRSRSRESNRLKASTLADRRRRSRSRESFKEKRVSSEWESTRRAESMERRRRSRSRESLHRRGDDREGTRHGEDQERRRGSRSRDFPRSSKGEDRESSRHEWRAGDGTYRSNREDRNFRDSRHFDNNRENMYRDKEKFGISSHDPTRGHRTSQFKDNQHSNKDSRVESTKEEENHDEYQERVALQLAAQEEDDPERIKEESRRRRQAILEKFKRQQQHKATEAESANGNSNSDAQDHRVGYSNRSTVGATASTGNDEMSCDAKLSLGKGASQNGILPEQTNADGGLGAGSPKSERSADMFCDDIFGESPAGGRRLGKGDGLALDTSGLTDNWDDAEGYYCFRIGEMLDGRYEVASSHGRGVFSTVVRARDLKAGRGEPEEVAIKIIRNNETMFKAGQQELVILKKLAGADPENKRHCVRLLSSFEYRSHLCLVFESLHMNLREILKKFGRNIGINLNAVRAYAKQLFIALKHLKNCGVLHCDIKPDNMLVNEAKNVLKLCDFGSAMFAGENEITPYLVSRFYRAPEIILGLPYDHALDIWSVGCCLYELYTGKMLFPGHTNNDMLRLHMELKGPFPKKMLKKAAFADQHFDHDFNFCASEEDPVTKKTIKRILVNVRPKDMGVLVSSSGSVDEDAKLLANFKDLLEKIFILDPDKRLTVSQALNHSFISGK